MQEYCRVRYFPSILIQTQETAMKILAFAASSSKHSINKQLVTHATEVLQTEIINGAEIDIIDLNDYEMPIYSIDRENDSGIPDKAHAF